MPTVPSRSSWSNDRARSWPGISRSSTTSPRSPRRRRDRRRTEHGSEDVGDPRTAKASAECRILRVPHRPTYTARMQTRGSVLLVDGRYELERELTRGPSVAVWRARDALLGRTVTLEVVHPALADDPAFTERLAEQARAMAAFSAPGLARLLDTGAEDGVPFLVRDEL